MPADDDADMDMDEGADMDMDEDEAPEAPMAAEPAKPSEFDAPAESDEPMKIVKNYLKPGEVDPNAAKSAATGLLLHLPLT